MVDTKIESCYNSGIMKNKTYTFEKGTNVSSYTVDSSNVKTGRDYVNNSVVTYTTSKDILFEYNFMEEELVNTYEGLMIFQRRSEDGKYNLYFVEENK